MPGDILDLINNALHVWFTSEDAMRWNPEAAAVEAESTSSADFSLAMLPSFETFGELSLYQPLPPLLPGSSRVTSLAWTGSYGVLLTAARIWTGSRSI